MQFRAQAVRLNVASNNDSLQGKLLFDEEGNYTVDIQGLQTAVKTGASFQFFGFEWQVVFVNEDKNVVTFWMVDPYTKSMFNKPVNYANGILLNGSNIWANGYSETVWNNDGTEVKIGASIINKFLASESEKMLADPAYAKYANKVVKGSVASAC